MKQLHEIVAFLDALLPPDHPADSSINGLQVANNGEIDRIYTAVDASWEAIQLAKNAKNALFFVHHGLFWRKQEIRITEAMYRKIDYMIRNNIALYASHLPLDQHPELGNNAVLLQQLGFEASSFHSFGPTYFSMTDHFNFAYHRRVKKKNFFDSFVVGYLSNTKGLLDSATLLSYNYAFKSL